MRLLVVHHQKLTTKRRDEIETARRFFNEHTPYEWTFEYRYIPDLQKHLVIEDGDNLDEHAIKDFVKSDADFVHLDISRRLWSQLRLRTSLYGQSEYIAPQGITYGRWTNSRNNYRKYLPTKLNYLSEVGLGIVHEVGHCLRAKHNMTYAFHSYAYGYKKLLTKADERAGVRPKRWEVTPYIEDFYASVPYESTVTFKYKGNPPITTIVLHHTAVSRALQPLQLNGVNTYHRQKWNDQSELGYYVGYNFFCEPTGLRTQTRKIGEETIAQIGNNCANPPHDCGMVSYCMAGNFNVEKPTQQQVDDFVEFYKAIKAKYPNVVVKQHKDVYPGRTCAELTHAEIQSWLDTTETKDEKIAELKAQVQQLIAMVTELIKHINK